MSPGCITDTCGERLLEATATVRVGARDRQRYRTLQAPRLHNASTVTSRSRKPLREDSPGCPLADLVIGRLVSVPFILGYTATAPTEQTRPDAILRRHRPVRCRGRLRFRVRGRGVPATLPASPLAPVSMRALARGFAGLGCFVVGAGAGDMLPCGQGIRRGAKVSPTPACPLPLTVTST